MKKIYTLLLTLFISVSAFASHISGGDIGFQWVGPGANDYLITLNLFRDCDGITMSTTEYMDATSTCGGNVTITLDLLNPGGTEVSQLCPAQLVNSTCSGGTFPGMQLYTYQALVTLAAPCDSWTLSWTTCCRNTTVNVPTSSSDDIYIQAVMNSVSGPQNNSPAYTSPPIPYVCINQPVNYNYGIVEPDGDSLSYSLVSAFLNGGANLVYGGGFSGAVPIPGISIDPVNGNISFTPTLLGNFIVVVQTNEYNSNGDLISTVMRDIQFVVLNCANQQPDVNSGVITGVNGSAILTSNYSIELCEGSTFSFTAVYTDPNPTDVLTITSNMGTVLANSTYVASGTNPLTVVYSWTVPAGAAGANTTFVSTITDGNCPILGLQTYVYEINVLDRTLAGPAQTICGNQVAPLQASGGNVFTWYDLAGNLIPVGPAFSCNPCDNPVAKPAVTTTYVVQSDLIGTCITSDTVTVDVSVDFTYVLSQSSNSACLFQPIQLNCVPSPAGAYSYSWSPSSYMSNSNIANPVMSPTASGTYWVYTNIANATGCIKTDSLQVTISQSAAPIVTAISDTVCIGSVNQLNVEFASTIPTVCGVTNTPCSGPTLIGTIGTGTASNTNTSYPAIYGNFYWGARHQILYTAADLTAMGFIGGKITSVAFDVSSLNASTTAYNNFEIKMKCTNAAQLGPNWESGFSTVFPTQNITVTTGWNTYNLATIYEWDGQSNLVLEVCFNNSSWDDNCSNRYTNTAYNSVLSYRADNSGVCAAASSPITATERPNIRFGYCGGTANPVNYSYAWSPANLVSNATIMNPTTVLPGSPIYQVIVTDIAGGCSDTATVTIANSTVPPDPSIVLPSQTFYCINDPAISVATITAGGVWQGNGIDAAGTFTPSLPGPGNHELIYTVYASPTCSLSDTLYLDVVSSPNATINFAINTQICQSANPLIISTVVGGGTWSGNGISSTGVFTPDSAGLGIHEIVYTLGTGNCIESDTISIEVVPLPNDSLIQAGPFCENDAPYNLSAIMPGGTWSGTGITNANLGTFDPATATPGIHIITYTYNNVCTFTNSMAIVVKPNPITPLITNNTPICEYNTLAFLTTTVQNAIYTWVGPNSFSANTQSPIVNNATIADSGDYYLVVQVDGCNSNPGLSIGVIIPTPPTPVITTNSPICEGQPLYFETDSFPGASYFWSGPNGFTSNLRRPVIGYATAAASGDYSIVKIANGCTSLSATINVTVNPTPSSIFFPNPSEVSVLDPTVEFLSQATAGMTYTWDFGDNETSNLYSPIHVYADSGLFHVILRVTDPLTGCESSNTKTVFVAPYYVLFIPTGFTPNGDGVNDYYRIQGNAFAEYSLRVFDRWGGKLFESDYIDNPWDGKIGAGNEAPVGAYVYMLKVKDIKGQIYEYNGSFNLLR